jgi:hypothetical protein
MIVTVDLNPVWDGKQWWYLEITAAVEFHKDNFQITLLHGASLESVITVLQ